MKPVFQWVFIVPFVVLVGLTILLFLRARLARPRFGRAEVIFQEWFASGCSERNMLTKLGGGRNCVRLVVTKDFLWVTSWFPFSILAALYDMEHAIPQGSIVSVLPSRSFGTDVLLLTFRDGYGLNRTLRLIPKKPEAFLKALGQPVPPQNMDRREGTLMKRWVRCLLGLGAGLAIATLLGIFCNIPGLFGVLR